MRAIEIGEGFGIENLRTVERDGARPGPGEVRLAMRAASLNYRDLLMTQGQYDPKQPLPLVPCSDGVGEVVEVGDGVHEWTPGDRVATLFAQGWFGGRATHARLRRTLGGPLDGTLRGEMVLPADGVVAVPAHLTDAEAATLPCAALTAWSALCELGDLRAGQTLVVEGTGGVSLFALQFGRLLGANVFVTSSSDAKLERARSLGATWTHNYREDPEWAKAVRAATGGVGADHVVEVGGAETLDQALRCLTMGGTISLIGNLTGLAAKVNLARILMNQVRVQGIFVGHRDGFEAMVRAIEAAELRPVVDRTFGFDEVVAAFEHMAAARHLGKIAIDLGDAR